MSVYPQQYEGYYYPTQYQPMFWTAVLEGLIGVTMLVAMGAWAFSLAKKAVKGEEVEFPL
jgi:hypothetical protein